MRKTRFKRAILLVSGYVIYLLYAGLAFAQTPQMMEPAESACPELGLLSRADCRFCDEIDGAHIYFSGLKVGEVSAKWLDRRNSKIWWMTQPHLLNGLNDSNGPNRTLHQRSFMEVLRRSGHRVLLKQPPLSALYPS